VIITQELKAIYRGCEDRVKREKKKKRQVPDKRNRTEKLEEMGKKDYDILFYGT
jgi:hypothetical protein